jgi:glycogen debranching enzyme
MANFTKDGYKPTYVGNVFVSENIFKSQHFDRKVRVPKYEDIKNELPIVRWDKHENIEKMYSRVWELAFEHIYLPKEESNFPSAYIDTAYNKNIFMWDSCFITMFAKYGTSVFPFQNTLNNFYSKQHPDGFICREIDDTGKDEFHRYDPVSTGPNIFSYSEDEYYRSFGDKSRLNDIFSPLVAFHQWLNKNRTWKDGSYWTTGWGSGMDNVPRVDSKYHISYSHGFMSWVDATLQQYINASLLIDFGYELERWQEILDINDEKKRLGEYIMNNMWDEERGFLFDVDKDGNRIKTMHIGAFWILHTDLLNKEQLDKVVSKLSRGGEFYDKLMIPSIPKSDDNFKDDGCYWQGGIWAPMTYMVINGLIKKGYMKEAFDISKKCLSEVETVFTKTNTFFEYYSPTKAEPGLFAREDFIGWTGLIPVSVLIESIFGITCDRANNTVNWNVNLDEGFGISNFPFGQNVLSLKSKGVKDGKLSLEIKSTEDFELKITWGKKLASRKIKKNTAESFTI